MIKVVCILMPQVHLLDLAGPVHIFYESNQFGGEYNLIYCSINQEAEISSSSGLSFYQLEAFENIQLGKGDIILIPGAEFKDLKKLSKRKEKTFYHWLTQQYTYGATICSICTGAYLLGECGLLDNKKYTTHWNYHEIFNRKFPKAQLITDRFFVDTGQIITSAGVSSGIDLSLYLLEKHYGSRLATDVAREAVIYLRRGSSDPQLSIFLNYRNHIDDRIHSVQNYIGDRLDQKIGVEELAMTVNMSPRNFTRQFKKVTGIPVSQYIERLRAERAYQLLKNQHPLKNVTSQCGFKSEERLRQLIKKYYHLLPSKILAE